jgi:hypothetical protein
VPHNLLNLHNCTQSDFVVTSEIRYIRIRSNEDLLYRVIQEELPSLMELISGDILSKKCHINLGPKLNIYRVTFVIGIFLNFNFNLITKLHHLNAFIVTKTN